MNKINLSAFLLFLLSLSMVAQTPNTTTQMESKKNDESIFKIDVQLRPRFEYLHGYKTLFEKGQPAGMNINQRSRLNIFFKNNFFQTKVVLQDVRVWGDQQQLVANEDKATSIHEAWAEAFINKYFSLKFGRQEIIYDDHRMFGNVNWAQQARSHDAAILKYHSNIFKAELAFAFNQDAFKLSGTDNKVNPKNYKAFQNLWMNYKPTDNFNISFLLLNNGLQLGTGGTAYSQTIGPRFTYKDKNFAAHATFYYQGGYNNNQIGTPATAQKINAMYLAADASYNFSKTFSALIGFENLSGDSQLEASTEAKSFIPFYGTNHKFNGFMDYFYVGNGFGNVGLQDYYLTLKTQTLPINFGLMPHYFMSAADVADPKNPTQALNKYLGTEIDFFFSFNIVENMKFVGGYSQMFATESLRALKGAETQATNNWAYAMIIFTPDLFIYKK